MNINIFLEQKKYDFKGQPTRILKPVNNQNLFSRFHVIIILNYQTKTEVKDLAVLEILYVKVSDNLVVQENVGATSKKKVRRLLVFSYLREKNSHQWFILSSKMPKPHFKIHPPCLKRFRIMLEA